MNRPDKILAAVSGEQIVLSNSLATVATRCVVIRDANGKSQSILSLAGISAMRTEKISYPGLLVVACGVSLIAAAAHISKDGGRADLPLVIVAALFGVFYLATRKAAVIFISGIEKKPTVFGTPREAAALIRAVEKAQEIYNETLPVNSELAS